MNKLIGHLINKLIIENNLNAEETLILLDGLDEQGRAVLYSAAREICDRIYGRKVFMRGLVEFSNYCKNDCLYCGIRRSNAGAHRYRLTPETILGCCRDGYEMGFRTFVLQSGEDEWWDDNRITALVRDMRKKFPDSAITLSVGEKSRETFQKYFDAGADRYLLRHETADECHYMKLHPSDMSWSRRIKCLHDLREIGFQVGAGFMVGSPYQKTEHLVKDLMFLKKFNPHMVGIGPFLPHSETPFAHEAAGTVERTLDMVAITRILLPKVLLPATTALGTLTPDGREYALNAGANVVMPNLSPKAIRADYAIYDNKISTGEEAAENCAAIKDRLKHAGYVPEYGRGDHPDYALRDYGIESDV